MSETTIRENLVIRSLSPALQRALVADLSPVHLRHQTPINPPGGVPEVIFPLSCVISIVTQTSDGQSVENAAVGYEGAFVQLPTGNVRAMIQIAGEALRMPRTAYVRHLSNEEFREAIDQYRDRNFAFACQAAVCQAFHTAEQRLAYWLLAMRDRNIADELLLTQDFLASMLGVQRPTVTIAARILQAADLIHYRYGRVTILDRAGLIDVACECYPQSALAFAP
jgi:hypothetical protein